MESNLKFKFYMSNEELLAADPLSLSPEHFNKWEALQKRVVRANGVYEKQLVAQVEHEELQARLFVAKRNAKVANLENMEATIKMEAIHEDYKKAVEAASMKAQELVSEETVSESQDQEGE